MLSPVLPILSPVSKPTGKFTSADERITAYMVEMADLMGKRETLRWVYRHLQTNLEDHPNLWHFLKSTERAADAIDRRIAMITLYLRNGVL